MGRGVERAFRDIFLGSTAERVVRRSQLPGTSIAERLREASSSPVVARWIPTAGSPPCSARVS
jgi:hypothetical protein